jgi:hypothetical protein
MRILEDWHRALWCKKGEDIVSSGCRFMWARGFCIPMKGSARCLHKDVTESSFGEIGLCSRGENMVI